VHPRLRSREWDASSDAHSPRELPSTAPSVMISTSSSRATVFRRPDGNPAKDSCQALPKHHPLWLTRPAKTPMILGAPLLRTPLCERSVHTAGMRFGEVESHHRHVIGRGRSFDDGQHSRQAAVQAFRPTRLCANASSAFGSSRLTQTAISYVNYRNLHLSLLYAQGMVGLRLGRGSMPVWDAGYNSYRCRPQTPVASVPVFRQDNALGSGPVSKGARQCRR
jgi:hypothetical protein